MAAASAPSLRVQHQHRRRNWAWEMLAPYRGLPAWAVTLVRQSTEGAQSSPRFRFPRVFRHLIHVCDKTRRESIRIWGKLCIHSQYYVLTGTGPSRPRSPSDGGESQGAADRQGKEQRGPACERTTRGREAALPPAPSVTAHPPGRWPPRAPVHASTSTCIRLGRRGRVRPVLGGE